MAPRAYPPALGGQNANAGFLKADTYAASALWRQKVNPLRGFLFPTVFTALPPRGATGKEKLRVRIML